MSKHMSSKPSTHVCPDCGRAYKAAETMNRHRKNHSETTQYVCSICAASFKRKDLLDRHSQIHAGGRQTTSRNRSQRACDRCSRLKTRCDNANPCTRCIKAGTGCTYKHLRTRARVERSSICSSGASTNSSVHSSPHIQPSEIPSLASESIASPPSASHSLSTSDKTSDRTSDLAWTQDLWMPEPAWQWPGSYNVPPGSAGTGACGSFQTMSPSGYDLDVSPVLDPLLKDDPSQQNTLNPDPTFNNPPSVSACHTNDWRNIYLRNDSGCSDLSSAFPYASDGIHSPDAVRAAQQYTVSELASIALGSVQSSEVERSQHWEQSAREIERIFGLKGIALSDTHILQHFQNLFFQNFHASWLKSEGLSSSTWPPHLYLTMAAIGAKYAGPRADRFQKDILDALRSKIILAAVERQHSDESTLYLVQSLALLQAAMIYFGDRDALDMAPQISAVTISLCRRIQLFDSAKFAEVQSYLGSGANSMDINLRRLLALEVRRLDAQVAQIFGTQPLLAEEDCNGHDVAKDAVTLHGQLGVDGMTTTSDMCWASA